MAMKQSASRPQAKAVQDCIANSVRAHLRAMSDPIPSQTKSIAIALYISAGMIITAGGVWGAPVRAAIFGARSINGTKRAQTHPARMVNTPKIISPVLRFLNCCGGGGGSACTLTTYRG